MTRVTLLAEINDILIDEGSNDAITEDTKLTLAGVDSFGVLMVLVAIDDKYNVYSKENFGKIDFKEITPKDIIDIVLKG